MAEPLAVTTAIITLTRTLKSVIEALDNFAKSHKTVQAIRSDCNLTSVVLKCITEQLNVTALPAFVTDADGDLDAGIDLQNLLDDNVKQLELEVNALAAELKALEGPGNPDTKLGRLVRKGQVAWKLPYLNTMHQKINTKRMQLEVVNNTLKE